MRLVDGIGRLVPLRDKYLELLVHHRQLLDFLCKRRPAGHQRLEESGMRHDLVANTICGAIRPGHFLPSEAINEFELELAVIGYGLHLVLTENIGAEKRSAHRKRGRVAGGIQHDGIFPNGPGEDIAQTIACFDFQLDTPTLKVAFDQGFDALACDRGDVFARKFV